MSSTTSFELAETPRMSFPRRTVRQIEPLKDARWNDFVQKHPRSSVFHSLSWLQALSQTYDYQPIAYTTSAPGENLENSIVFCRVESWLTGRRLVSLPFSDHCEPLIDAKKDREAFVAAIEQEARREDWNYVELRPLQPFETNGALFQTTVKYAFHQLDLSASIDKIFANFHKSSIQRKIRRAEREGLRYCEGSSEELLDRFYGLLKLTRQRHRLPPQPRKWFVNLMESFGPALKIRIAFNGDQSVAAMLTLLHKDTLVYKYGCSHSRFNNLGGMHLLFWHAIREAKNERLRFLDFGRTDADQQGLITFKNRWGTTQNRLTYVRYGVSDNSTHLFDLSGASWKAKVAKYALSLLPRAALSKLGQVLYGHVG